jgi:hypothetical protein
MATSSGSQNQVIHIVEKAMSTDQLIMIMYNSPDQIVYDHFKMVNSHLKNNQVQVGQVVLLSPADSKECTIEETEFLKAAKLVDQTLLKLNKQEREILAAHYDFLSKAASYSGLLLGVNNTAWKAHTDQVTLILKNIEQSYVSSYNSTGNLNNRAFFAQRKMHFQRLDSALRRFGQPEIGGKLVSGDIRNNLGLSSKSIVHNWSKQPGNVTTIPNFNKNYETVAKMSRKLKRVGYFGIALTGIDAGANIQKACTANDPAACSKAKYTQGGKAIGNVIGGSVGGSLAAWGTCSLIFGLPSGGSSFFWCSIVAGAGGGYLGGSYVGEYGESKGETLYNAYGTR